MIVWQSGYSGSAQPTETLAEGGGLGAREGAGIVAVAQFSVVAALESRSMPHGALLLSSASAERPTASRAIRVRYDWQQHELGALRLRLKL
jgi:hypothetical protein